MVKGGSNADQVHVHMGQTLFQLTILPLWSDSSVYLSLFQSQGTRKKLEDIDRKLSVLYDLLRENRVSSDNHTVFLSDLSVVIPPGLRQRDTGTEFYGPE